jgi:hypothetical protein
MAEITPVIATTTAMGIAQHKVYSEPKWVGSIEADIKKRVGMKTVGGYLHIRSVPVYDKYRVSAELYLKNIDGIYASAWLTTENGWPLLEATGWHELKPYAKGF